MTRQALVNAFDRLPKSALKRILQEYNASGADVGLPPVSMVDFVRTRRAQYARIDMR